MYDRAKKCVATGIAIALSLSTAILIFVQIFPESVLTFFGVGPDAVKSGVEYMRTFSVEYLFIPILFCFNGLIMGAGHTFFTLISGTVSSLFLRIPVALILGKWMGLGLTGGGLAGPAATFAGVCLAGWFLFTGRWKKDKTGIHRENEQA